MKFRWYILFLLPLMVFAACRKSGCTDPTATNYEKAATKESGECTYSYGCTDSNAVNFDPDAQFSNGTCIFQGKVVLYLAEKFACDTITVALDNSAFRRLTTVFGTGGVLCGQSGAANFSLDPGQYNYYVTSDSTCNWNGKFTIQSRQCTKVAIRTP